MITKGGSSKRKLAVEYGVTGALFCLGLVVVGTMMALNRVFGGLDVSPPIVPGRAPGDGGGA